MRIVRQIVLMLLVGLVATPPTTWADASVDAGKKSRMQTCNVGRLGSLYSISNAATVDSCTSAGSVGLFTALCQCQNDGIGGYEWTSVSAGGVDLSAYALLAGDEDGQTIYGVADEGNPSSVGTLLLGVGAAANVVLRAGTTGGSVFAGGTTARLRGPSANDVFEAADGFVKMSSVSGYALITAPAVRVVSAQTPPTNADDTCTTGDTIDTATFHYYCADTDTWVRVAMATWP